MRPPGALQLSTPSTRLGRAALVSAWLLMVSLLGPGVGFGFEFGVSAAGATTDLNSNTDSGEQSSSIAGRVVDSVGEPVAGLKATLNTAALDRSVERFLRPVLTDNDGRFRFADLDADCYLVIFEAPVGASFDAAAATTEHYSCLDPGQSDTTADAALTAGRLGDPFSVNLLHIGDHHSHLLPRTITVELAGEATEIEVGGLARVATVVSERSDALGAESTVTINSGGSLGGTIFHTVFGGAADAAALNTICFDLLGIGADELTRDSAELRTFFGYLADGRCQPVILGNPAEYDWQTEPRHTAKPVHPMQFEEGVVGFISVRGAKSGSTAEPVSQVQREIDRLASLGVHNVVLLSTIGLADDLEMVAQLSGVDAVVGGGSHSLLGNFAGLGLAVEGRYPVETENIDGDLVCVGHAWQYASVVGELQLAFDGEGRLAGCWGEAHLLLATIAEDPVTKATVDGYANALKELAAEPLAIVRDELCFTAIPTQTVGLLCSDDVIGDGRRRPADVQLLIAAAFGSQADVGIVNSGIVDQGLSEGTLNIGDAYGTLAIDGESGNRDRSVYLLRMTGAELTATLEQAIEAAVGDRKSRSAYPFASGLRWTYDSAQPLGQRLTDVQLESLDGEPIPIDPQGFYMVATTGFLASGGDGYQVMAAVTAEGRASRTGIEYTQVLLNYIRTDLDGTISQPPGSPSTAQ